MTTEDIVTADMGPAGVTVRRGADYWLTGYRMMLRFEVMNQRTFLPVFAVVQLLLGAGMAVMYGFFLGAQDLPPTAAAYIATGIPALALIPLGFLALPMVVGQLRERGSYDFVWSLPVPKLAAAAATFTVYTLLALPGTVIALLVSAWRYDVSLSVRPTVVPALLLTSLMSASVGFGLAHCIENVAITNLIGNMLIFVVLLFSPIIVPISQFPGWLAGIHEWLPFHHMAVVIRAGLFSGLDQDVWRSYAVIIGWTVGSWLLAGWAIGRRR